MAELLELLSGSIHLGASELEAVTTALSKLLKTPKGEVRAAAMEAAASLAVYGHEEEAQALASTVTNKETKKALEQRISERLAEASPDAAIDEELDQVGEGPLDFELS